MSEQSNHTRTCAACRVIDMADGVEDGNLYPVLATRVGLEAIFLSTFVMVSQNRQAARSEIRSQLDFETNLRAEIWAVHIGQALGVDPTHVENVVNEAIEGSRSHLSETTS